MFLVPDSAIPSGERVKLLDFGIAKFLTPALSQTTSLDVVMGSPRYMSPEQCEGREKVDSKVDVYSLGVGPDRCQAGGAATQRSAAAGRRSRRRPALPTSRAGDSQRGGVALAACHQARNNCDYLDRAQLLREIPPILPLSSGMRFAFIGNVRKDPCRRQPAS